MTLISTWAPLIPLLVGLFAFNYLPNFLRIVVIYLLFSLLIDVASRLLLTRSVNNMPLLHAFTLAEFLLITFYLKKQFDLSADKKILTATQIAFTFFTVVNSAFIQPIHTFNTYARGVESLVIIVLVVIIYFKKISEVKKEDASYETTLWINSGLLLYFSASLLLFMLNDYVGKSNLTLYKMMWNMHAIFCIIMYLAFAVGLWRYKTA